MIRRSDLLPQYLAYRDEIREAIDRVLTSGRYVLGDEVREFEREFAAYLGVRHVVGVADGTRAIALVLRALGIGLGDEVITTAFTAFPTIGAILETGATPVFADIDEASYLMSIDDAVARVTRRTKAVVPVHIFGNVVDVQRLRTALPPGIKIIEDAAQAHGSSIRRRSAGSIGDAGTFSFYPTKNLGGYGDGGAVATDDDELAGAIRLLRDHGQRDKDHVSVAGVNSRLDELQAAVLRVKLRHLDDMNAARRRIADRYTREIADDDLRPQSVAPDVVPNWHVFEVRVLRGRAELARSLDDDGIQTNVYYEVPQHLQAAISHLGYHPGSLPRTETVCGQALALPMYPELTTADLDRVIGAIVSSRSPTTVQRAPGRG